MEGFAERLQSLIGEMSVSAFARKVGLSEALIRKYLKGAEPGLTRANQIAMGANCSLEWLATGCGYLYRQAEVVDREALAAAQLLLGEQQPGVGLPDEEALVTLLAYYQFLRTHKKADGFLDLALAREFGRHLGEA
ncbi:helix-turn-helix domain-containing protein [Aeromonas veronii]|uniref:helix-turn-helix domain-containing protein n=1 Tax=Aeromonas TaxID=642 RepID=UPI00111A27C5|nr:helix-turn-helix transcriptional regulator [Aeromonas veronii]ELC7281013.1 helix-turn-helix transcriptional regulator [Aeromonas veronii]MCF5843483.1 helix-turn-helix domain-containing protein [Aeromonas veronii]MCF5891288.1 helix-turn-helix domain-containing protein [Aeromonas veronii]MCX9132993.1 helix-turn-helix domain-containing protein [Aeromonas veronii]TNI15094.1 transcriptional regulator [Aeromonas veronii]